FRIVGIGVFREAHPRDVAAVALGPEQGEAGRIGTTARKPGEHVEQDLSHGVIRSRPREVAGDAAHLEYTHSRIGRERAGATSTHGRAYPLMEGAASRPRSTNGGLDDESVMLDLEVHRTLAAQLREERRRSGLTLVEVARQSGVSTAMISKIENAQ